MKALNLLNLFLLTLCIVSCGSKSEKSTDKEILMTPTTTQVSGDLGDCFTVVNREYKVIDNNYSKILTVELKRTSENLPFNPEGRKLFSFSTSSVDPNIKIGFGIEFLDKDGNVLDKVIATGSGLSASYDPDEAVELAKLRPDETGTIRFSVENTEAVNFRISSAYEESDGDIIPSSTSDNSVSSTTESEDKEEEETSSNLTSSDENWDELLDAYEDLVDSYIKFLQKYQEGDLSALTEYMEALEKAQKYSEELSEGQGVMSSSQIKRYLDITQKMSDAALSAGL